jgi:hypothetical protein
VTATTFKHNLSGYVHHRCRCPTCRAAKAADDARRRTLAKAKRELARPDPATYPPSLAVNFLHDVAGWTWVEVASIDWWTPEEVRACARAHGNRWADVRQAVEVLAEAMALPGSHERHLEGSETVEVGRGAV